MPKVIVMVGGQTEKFLADLLQYLRRETMDGTHRRYCAPSGRDRCRTMSPSLTATAEKHSCYDYLKLQAMQNANASA